MEMIKGENINLLPYRELKKISDLIYFDGPILSHFKDEYEKNILFYWVDNDKNVNRWIVFQISEDQLGQYLLKNQTLYNLFESPLNDVFYSVEIGNTLEYKNVKLIFKDDLQKEYFPEENSLFDSNLPEFYQKSLKIKSSSYAKLIFMDSSLFIKASPSENGKNSNLVGVLDGADFLYGIGNSFKGLIEVETTKEFVKRGIADNKRIKKATAELIKAMQPNLVETKAASFAIALSPNSFNEVGETFLNKKWRDDVFNKFKKEIIEIDKKNEKEIADIIDNYGENNTSNIYKPLIELYNSNKLTISITDKKFQPKRTVHSIKKEFVQKLISTKSKSQEEPEDRIAKVKFNKKTGKISGTSGATLFDQSVFASWKTREIIVDKKRYMLKRDLISEYKIENKLHIIENDDLKIYATGDSKPEVDANFYLMFDELYKELIEVENTKLDSSQIEMKKYMQFYLK